jgi:hypothetical protein
MIQDKDQWHEYGDETPGSIKRGEFTHQTSEYKILKKDCSIKSVSYFVRA